MNNMPPADLAIPDEKRARSDSLRSWLARNGMRLAGLLLVLVIASRFTLHRGNVEQDKAIAGRLIQQFHDRLNAGQFDQIYDESHPMFKNARSHEMNARSLQEVRDQFGAFQRVSDSEMHVLIGPTMQIRAACNSAFEKGDATELFGFLREGPTLKLAFYQVSSGSSNLNHKSERQLTVALTVQ